MSHEDSTQNLPTFEERVLSALASIEQRLTSLEEQAERKALETKPIWERALSEIVELRQEMRDGFEDIESKISVLNQDVLRLRSLELRQRRFDPGAN
jgi:DNA repair ATPase RecN